MLIWEHVGSDGNVGVVLNIFDPNVRCQGRIQYWESCNRILYNMDAKPDPLVLGPMFEPPDPRVDVALPAVNVAGWYWCQVYSLRIITQGIYVDKKVLLGSSLLLGN